MATIKELLIFGKARVKRERQDYCIQSEFERY